MTIFVKGPRAGLKRLIKTLILQFVFQSEFIAVASEDQGEGIFSSILLIQLANSVTR